MRTCPLLLLPLLLAAGCSRDPGAEDAPGESRSAGDYVGAAPSSSGGTSLADARRGFTTNVTRPNPPGDAPPTPPSDVFRLVSYDSPVGKLAAYLSPDPGDGRRHPAIVWITGGDCNSIDELWKDAPRKNDQTAAAYRKAGLIMMFPSLRGGNNNPGRREGFFGEVDDVLAATDFLAQQSYVDPQRIYLGGHSTGGTLVMLTAETSGRYRAVLSFGPVADVRGYGPEYCPFDVSNPKEAELRAPGLWLASVKSPLFVFEGASPSGNIAALQAMAGISKNPLAHFHPVPGLDHFRVLAPVNDLIAEKILRDDGPTTNLSFSEEELRQAR